MEIDYYDLALEGTSIIDLGTSIKPGKVIVIDKNGNYGTTYNSLDKFKKCIYISDVVFNKVEESKVAIEAYPQFLPASYKVIETLFECVIDLSLDFIAIKNVIFIDSNFKTFKIPIKKTEIVLDKTLNNLDRYYLYKAISNRNISIIKDYVEKNHDENSLLFKIFCKYGIFNHKNFEEYSKSFETCFCIYPKYGISSLIETACFNKSVKGYTYLINDSIEVSKNDDDEYKFRVDCSFGTIFVKDYIPQCLKEKQAYVRFIELSKEILNGNFIIFLETEELVKVYGLNSKSKVCQENHQILYFITSHKPFDIKNFSYYNIEENDILKDISYKTLYDFDIF